MVALAMLDAVESATTTFRDGGPLGPDAPPGARSSAISALTSHSELESPVRVQRLAAVDSHRRGFEEFLEHLSDRAADISPEQATAIRTVWFTVSIAVGPKLRPPQVEAGEDGAIKLAWSREAFYAEVDVHPPDERGHVAYEWFFRDRVHDRHAGSSDLEPQPPGRALFDALRAAFGT